MRITFALATAALALAACSGDKAAKAAADSAAALAAAAAAAPIAPTLITVNARDFSFDAPERVAAGMVTIKLISAGPGMHHVQLMRLTDGKTAADLEAGIKASKPDSPPPPWAHEVAGPNVPPQGGETVVTQQLEEGNYAIVCFIPGADGIPHVMKGMIRALTVMPATTAAAPAPVADVTVTMNDYSWEITPELTAGKHVLKIENAAAQPHEMVMALLEPGKKPSDLAAWIKTQAGPPPGVPVAGISGMTKGSVVYVPVDLKPGEYGLLCFLPDAKDGKLHVEHGMLKQITVK